MTHMPHKLRLILQFLNPWFLYDFIHLYRHNTFEDLVFQLSDKYHAFAQSQQSLFAIANAQRPQWGTLNIIKELKQRGYKIYLLSNIGQVMFDQFKQQCPEIFSSFDDFFVSSPANGYIHKPDPRMFELFLQHFGFDAQNVIFIDDKIANIQTASALGMQALLFLSPEKLRLELENIGALPTQPAAYKDELLSISYYFVHHPQIHHFS
jgi:HAD superfamily hydrolase (TIGR01509 family)